MSVEDNKKLVHKVYELSNQGKLDQALEDDRTTILLLSGGQDSKCEEVHAFVDGYDWEPWRHYFLITDLLILMPAELDQWFDGPNPDQYAVIGGATIPKPVARKGPVEHLLKADGGPSILKIRSVFAAGDQV